MTAFVPPEEMDRELAQLDRDIDVLRQRIIEAAQTKPAVLLPFKRELDALVASWN